jgi:outer membrane receptor protein involved in Fe transport
MEASQQQQSPKAGVLQTEYNYDDKCQTLGAAAEFHTSIDSHKISYGLDYYFDYVNSSLVTINPKTGVTGVNSAYASFPDGSKYATLGIYGQDEWKVFPDLKITPSARFSRFDYSTQLRPAFTDLNGNLDNLIGGLSTVYSLSGNLNLCANLSQAFRAPNLNNLAALLKGKQGITVPNPDLKPERTTTAEIGLKVELEDLQFSLFGFFTDVVDRAERVKTTYNGLSKLDGLDVYSSNNIGKSQIVGIEFGGKYFIVCVPGMNVSGNFTYVKGRNIVFAEPLSMMPPPFFGKIGIAYGEGDFSLEAYSRFASAVTELSAADKTDPRIDPNGTPAWMTANIRAAINISNICSVSFGVENILNAAYREQFSGVDGLGTNLFVGTEVKF